MKDEVLGAYVDLLLSTDEKYHVQGDLYVNFIEPDENGVSVGYCALGLMQNMDWRLVEKLDLDTWDEALLVNYLLGHKEASDRIIKDNDTFNATFHEIGERIKDGLYTDDNRWREYESRTEEEMYGWEDVF